MSLRRKSSSSSGLSPSNPELELGATVDVNSGTAHESFAQENPNVPTVKPAPEPDKAALELQADRKLLLCFLSPMGVIGIILLTLQTVVVLYSAVFNIDLLHRYCGIWDGFFLVFAAGLGLLSRQILKEPHWLPKWKCLPAKVTQRLPNVLQLACIAGAVAFVLGCVALGLQARSYGQFPSAVLLARHMNEESGTAPWNNSIATTSPNTTAKANLKGTVWHTRRSTVHGIQSVMMALSLAGAVLSSFSGMVLYNRAWPPKPPKKPLIPLIEFDEDGEPVTSEPQTVTDKLRKISRAVSVYVQGNHGKEIDDSVAPKRKISERYPKVSTVSRANGMVAFYPSSGNHLDTIQQGRKISTISTAGAKDRKISRISTGGELRQRKVSTGQTANGGDKVEIPIRSISRAERSISRVEGGTEEVEERSERFRLAREITEAHETIDHARKISQVSVVHLQVPS